MLIQGWQDRGYASLLVSISFLGGMQLMVFGMVGQYVAAGLWPAISQDSLVTGQHVLPLASS
jgi:hypothetical protein